MSFAFVFPGQGSQKVGMMDDYREEEVVRDTFKEASAALQQDLWTLAADGPADALVLTENTQPLMLTADIAFWRLWKHKGGRQPSILAGHSLGEYAALVASETIELVDAVPLVRLRARAMQEAVPPDVGGMAAIVGINADAVILGCSKAADGDVVEAVNFNEPAQTIIAGNKAAVERAIEACKAMGAKRAMPLPVSAPFHSSLMRPSVEKLAARLAEIELKPPQIPVVNNVDVAVESDPSRIRDALVRQAFHPVRWVEVMQHISDSGAGTIVECGPGKVLTGLVKRCQPACQGVALADPGAFVANHDLE